MSTKIYAPQQTVQFSIKDKASDCEISLSGGESLGYVQSVAIHAEVGSCSTVVIKTICTRAQAEILQKNTEVHVVIMDDEPSSKPLKT